jgi:hypothetical protein
MLALPDSSCQTCFELTLYHLVYNIAVQVACKSYKIIKKKKTCNGNTGQGKPQVQIIKGLNLAAVKLANVQVTKLLLVARVKRAKHLYKPGLTEA